MKIKIEITDTAEAVPLLYEQTTANVTVNKEIEETVEATAAEATVKKEIEETAEATVKKEIEETVEATAAEATAKKEIEETSVASAENTEESNSSFDSWELSSFSSDGDSALDLTGDELMVQHKQLKKRLQIKSMKLQTLLNIDWGYVNEKLDRLMELEEENVRKNARIIKLEKESFDKTKLIFRQYQEIDELKKIQRETKRSKYN